MREIVHIQAGQCGNQIGAKVGENFDGKFNGNYAESFEIKQLKFWWFNFDKVRDYFVFEIQFGLFICAFFV